MCGRKGAGAPKLTSWLFQKNSSVIWSLESFVELGKQFLITQLSSTICSHTPEVNWLNRASSGVVVALSEEHEVILWKEKQMRSFWLSAEKSWNPSTPQLLSMASASFSRWLLQQALLNYIKSGSIHGRALSLQMHVSVDFRNDSLNQSFFL